MTVSSSVSPNRFLRLPFVFDEQRLRQDLHICLADQWRNHFNSQDHAGSWTGIALRSATGETQDILAHPTVDGYRDTVLLAACRYFSEVLGSFHCEKEGVRLLRLAPGSCINEHRDRGAGYQHGIFRIHIPIVTNDAVCFRVGGCELPMKNGECWYADFDLPHSVVNNSLHERIHLVADCQRNPWSDDVFRGAGYDFAFEARSRRPDADTRKRMIEQLSRMNTDVARRLIETLQQEQEGNA